MKVAVFHNIPQVQASMRTIERQTPFAISRALNATAVDVQRFEHEQQVPGRLTIRNQWSKPRTKFGINIRFASKVKLESEIGSRAPWLASQERGATLRPAGKVRLVPTIGGARPTQQSKVVRALKPRKGNAKIFFHRRFKAVFRLRGRGRNARLQMLFTTAKRARVKPRLAFEPSGAAKAQAVYQGHFDRELARAIATAK